MDQAMFTELNYNIKHPILISLIWSVSEYGTQGMRTKGKLLLTFLCSPFGIIVAGAPVWLRLQNFSRTRSYVKTQHSELTGHWSGSTDCLPHGFHQRGSVSTTASRQGPTYVCCFSSTAFWPQQFFSLGVNNGTHKKIMLTSDVA